MSKFKVGEKVLVEGVVTNFRSTDIMDVEVRAGGKVYDIKYLYSGDVFPVKQEKVKVMMPVVEPGKDEPEYKLGQVMLYQGEVCYITHIEEKQITSIHPGENSGHTHYTVSSIGTGREQKVLIPEFLDAYEENACYSEDVHDLARITKKYVDFMMQKHVRKAEMK